MSAVMIAPIIDVTYGNYLKGYIEVSDAYQAGWERVASFDKFYQYVRRIPAKAETAIPVLADVGKYLYGGTTNDDGIVVSFDAGLFTVDGYGNIYVAMVGADDLYDDVDETLIVYATAGGGGGAGTFSGVATAKSVLMPSGGIFTCRFHTKKRYVRFNCDIVGNFQRVMVGLVPYPFDTT